MPFTHSVQVGDELIRLTEREFSLALLLFRNAGRAMSRQAILRWFGGVPMWAVIEL